MLKSDVIIVGAGPTGLMAANQLARFNVDFIIIDSKSGPTEQSRAIAVTARSLEIYEQMGLSDEILVKGQRIESFHFFSQGKQRGVVEIGKIGRGLSDFNFLLGFEQSKNEEILVRNLKEHGIDVLWETSFIELVNNSENVRIKALQKGTELSIEAKYLIACDGASSPVRHQLKMSFEGGTYENKFFVADTVLKWKLGYTGLVVSPGDKNFVAFFPMKGKSNFRVIGTMPDDYHQKTDVTFDDIEKVVIETLGIEVLFEKVNWFSVYNLHHRRVDNFRVGNVFVAGDAAHIHSPAGGQGMNTGLQDAYNLAWKLAFVLKGHGKEILLDTYDEERLPFAKWLMSFTDRGFNLLTSNKKLIVFIRKYFAANLVGLFLKFKWLRPIAFKTVSQLWYSYHGMSLSGSSTSQKLKFNTGDRLPYVIDEKTSMSIYHHFIKPAFHLLHLSDEELAEKAHKELTNSFPFPIYVVEQQINPWRSHGVNKELFILVRPDNYISYLMDSLEINQLKEHLKRYFLIGDDI